MLSVVCSLAMYMCYVNVLLVCAQSASCVTFKQGLYSLSLVRGVSEYARTAPSVRPVNRNHVIIVPERGREVDDGE